MKHLLVTLFFGWSCAFGYYPNFDDNPRLNKSMKQLLEPHLINLDHPIKDKLDRLFAGPSVTASEDTLIKAGFEIIASMPRSFIYVVRHPMVKDYVMKLYLDSEKNGRFGTPGWEWLARRCSQATKVRKLIESHQITSFTVPDKWIYVLPQDGQSPQPVILVATDMELAENSHEAWKKVPTPRTLKELYIILNAGYGSNQLASNVPYTKNGTFAFVDTEKDPGKLRGAKRYLSKRMGLYWSSMVD